MSIRTFGLRPLLAVLLLVVSPAFLSSPAYGNLTIDDYTAGSTIARFTAGTSNQFTASGSILGGERDDSLTLRDLGGEEFIGILGFDGDMQIAQGAQDQIFGSMTYDGFATIDLTDGGQNYAFRLSVAGVDTTMTVEDVFSITVNDGVNNTTVEFDLPGSDDVPGDVDIRFDQFAGVDFTSLESIVLSFDFMNAPGHDLSLAGFHAIPEPSQSALLLLAATAWTTRRRRSYQSTCSK